METLQPTTWMRPCKHGLKQGMQIVPTQTFDIGLQTGTDLV